VSHRSHGRLPIGFSRLLGVFLALSVLLGGLVQPAAAAIKLSIRDAENKSLTFAKNTCARDKLCDDYGVLNCRRQSLHVVLCRIFDERHTEAQGRYRCDRLVRLAIDPDTHRIPVTGLGRWHC
jgi:hypothetical protein